MPSRCRVAVVSEQETSKGMRILMRSVIAQLLELPEKTKARVQAICTGSSSPADDVDTPRHGGPLGARSIRINLR